MHINIEKCKVMGIGKRASKIRYTILDHTTGLRQQLKETEEERYLDKKITNDLKPRSHLEI